MLGLWLLLQAVLWFLPLESILADRISHLTGRRVHVGEVTASLLWGLTLSASDLVVEERRDVGYDQPFLTAAKIEAHVRLLPLLRSRLSISSLSVEQPVLSVVRMSDGRFNLPGKAGVWWKMPVPSPVAASVFGADSSSLRVADTAVRGAVLHLHNQATGASSQIAVDALEGSFESEPNRLSSSGELSLPGLTLAWRGTVRLGPHGNSWKEGTQLDLLLTPEHLQSSLQSLFPGFRSEGFVELHADVPRNSPEKPLKVELTANGLMLTADAFRGKAISFDDFLIRMETRAAPSAEGTKPIRLLVHSTSAGLDGHLNAEIPLPWHRTILNAENEWSVNLESLARCLGPLLGLDGRLRGLYSFQGSIQSPDEQGTRHCSGRMDFVDVEITGEERARPFREPKASFEFDVSTNAAESLTEVRFAEVSSRTLKMSAHGSVAGDAGGMNVQAKADLDSLDALLSGLGLKPESLILSGSAVLSARVARYDSANSSIDLKTALADAGIRIDDRLMKPRGVPAQVNIIGRWGKEFHVDDGLFVLGPLTLNVEASAMPPWKELDAKADLPLLDLDEFSTYCPRMAQRKASGRLGFHLEGRIPMDREPSLSFGLPRLKGQVELDRVRYSLIPDPDDSMPGLPALPPHVLSYVESMPHAFVPELTGVISADPAALKSQSLSITMAGHTMSLSGQVRDYAEWPSSHLSVNAFADVLEPDLFFSLADALEALRRPIPSDGPKHMADGFLMNPPGTFGADLNIGAETLLTMDVPIPDFSVSLSLREKELRLTNVEGHPFGGSISGSGKVSLNGRSSVARLSLQGEDIKSDSETFASLRRTFPLFGFPVSTLLGKFRFQTELSGECGNPQAFRSTLSGQGTLDGSEGIRLGFDYLRKVTEPTSEAAVLNRRASEPMRLSGLHGAYQIHQGMVNFELRLDKHDEPSAKIIGTTYWPDMNVTADLILPLSWLGESQGGESDLGQNLIVRLLGDADDPRPSSVQRQ